LSADLVENGGVLLQFADLNMVETISTRPGNGFWFIRNKESAKRATFLVGVLVCLIAGFSGFLLRGYPDTSVLLLPFSLGYVGWKILVAHARGWALLLVIVVAAINAGVVFAPEMPERNELEVIGWLLWAFLVYGWVGAVAYRRLEVLNAFGLSHRDVVRQTKTGISVGFGTCCCVLLVPGISHAVQNPNKEAITALIVMPFFLLAFVDPLLEYLNHLLGIRHTQMVAGRWKARIGVFCFGILAVLLHGFLAEGIGQAGFFTPALFFMLVFVPGQITAGWIDGSEKKRSWWLGLSRGFMLGLISVWLIWLFLRDATPQPNIWELLRLVFHPGMAQSPSLGKFTQALQEPTPGWIQLAIANACNWSLFGFMGGIARDRGTGRRGIFAMLLVAVTVEGALLAWASVRLGLVGFDNLERVLILQLLLVLGWGIGILIYPPAEGLLQKDRVNSSYVAPPPVS
jgi:hypothetical protein